MITVFLPQYNRTLKLQKGESLQDLFQREGFYLQSDCAGVGTCGKCIVRIPGCRVPVKEVERKHLSPEQLAQGLRLSCQVVPTANCQVEFVTIEAEDSDQILTEGQRQTIVIDPAIKRRNVQVEKPELASATFDLESVTKALKTDNAKLTVPLSLLSTLPAVLREGQYNVSAIFNDHHLIAIEPGHSEEKLFGLAIDLGTTTLVAKLIDLQTGIVQGVASALNPQQRLGADVISRIGYSQRRSNAFQRLQKLVIDRLNNMIGTIALQAGISTHRIFETAVVGNTVMGHLLLALDSTHLALSPYTPVVKCYPEVSAGEIGLGIHPRANVRLLPNIGRFVGGDTTGVILATGLDQSHKLTLIIDIGTNGEIVLGNKDRILATSTAAGPAFEGAKIKFGMRATKGAIDRVEIHDGNLILHTVEQAVPKGICGSGIICLIGELLKANVLSWSGQLLDNHQNQNPILNRVQSFDQNKIFMLHQENDNPAERGKDIYLTQRDVREIQLAKSAIRTGIQLLLSEFGISADELDRILLAGAFGNFLDREQAIRIGLLPDVPIDKIRFIGNAACAGAELFLLSKEMQDRALAIAAKTRYFEIATHPNFQDQYAENMLFPFTQ